MPTQWFDFTNFPARVAECNRLDRQVTRLSDIRVRTNRPEDIANWEKAVERWYQYSGFDSDLLYIFESNRFLKALSSGEAEAKETAITFLEYDCYYFRSGYMKSKILVRLKHLELSRQEKTRLQRVICNAIVSPRPKCEFKYYARLLKTVGTPDFRQEIENLPISGTPWLKARRERCLWETYWARPHSPKG